MVDITSPRLHAMINGGLICLILLGILLFIYLSGGYATGLLPNLKTLNLALIIVAEAILAICWLAYEVYSIPPQERDPFDMIGGGFFSFLIIVVAGVLDWCIFKWPKPTAACGAVAHLLILIMVIRWLWQSALTHLEELSMTQSATRETPA